MKIGIVGRGFVGNAVYEGLKNFYDVNVFDLDKNKSNCGIEDLVLKSSIIFQCLPTPMKKSGECDLSIVEKSLEIINNLAIRHHIFPIVIIKSTVPPGTCERLNEFFSNINLVFSPEFLTEANSVNDFKNQTRIVLGGPRPYTTQVKIMFKKAFPNIPIIKTGYKTAEMVKYFINNFLATKISFANEMYEICESLDIDYDKVTEYSLYDPRIGKSHLAVPGHDGDMGFGGHCFPKDLNAMIYLMTENNLTSIMLEATREKNDTVRKNRDWENMPGRAVSKGENNE